MIKLIVLVIGLVHFLDAIFEKHNVWQWVEEKGANQSSKFIYQLTNCRFCMKFHISVIITMLSVIFLGFSVQILLIPFVTSGLTYLIEKR